MSNFLWELLVKEIEEKAPILLSLLYACVDIQRRQENVRVHGVLGRRLNHGFLLTMLFFILHYANHHVNLVISLILDKF